MIHCHIDKCPHRGANYCFAKWVAFSNGIHCTCPMVYFPKEEILEHVWCSKGDCKYFLQLKDTDVWGGKCCIAEDIEFSEKGCLTYDKV